jgi:hypothetical protein
MGIIINSNLTTPGDFGFWPTHSAGYRSADHWERISCHGRWPRDPDRRTPPTQKMVDFVAFSLGEVEALEHVAWSDESPMGSMTQAT